MRIVELAAVASCSLAIAGCPHDWSSFASVPTDDPRQDSALAMPDAPVEAGTDAPGANETLYAKLSEKPTVITADAEGIVFITKEGSVLACGHDGCGNMRTVASGQHDLRAVALGDGFIAWAARGDHVLRRSPRSMPGPAQEVDENDGLVAVAVTASRLYFAVDALDVAIGSAGVRYCKPGVDCQNVVRGSFADGQVTELRFDGADAFWLGAGTVVGCSIDACNGDTAKKKILASEPVLPNALALDTELVYYASPEDGGSVRALSRAALVGAPAAPHLLASKVGIATRLAATKHSVWMTSTTTGAVTRIPRTGGAPVTVASGLALPTGIASADGYVYVTCAGDGRILRWSED
jgi:hypothetical protein